MIGVLERWLPELLGPLPNERSADCERCVMCAPDDWIAELPKLRYAPEQRCCSYLPRLSNFQVGAGLDPSVDLDPRGRRSLQERVDSSEYALPIGLWPPQSERDLAARSLERQADHTDTRQVAPVGAVCPHFLPDEGHCGVWAVRNATCGTWFCRHDRGLVGQGTWLLVRHALTLFEQRLAAEAVRRLLPGSDGHDWGAWDRGAEAFYLESWALVQSLDTEALEQLVTPQLHRAVMMARRGLAAHHRGPMVPSELKFQDPPVLKLTPAGARVASTLARDALWVDAGVWAVLPAFDGRPVKQVLRIAAGRGVQLDAALLGRLVDFNVLG